MRKYPFVVLCLLLVNLGMCFSGDAIEVRITKPPNGATVSKIIEVGGTSKGISAERLWICVYPPGVSRYYPPDKRDFPISMASNGSWSTKVVIGRDVYTGSEFKLCAVVVDEKANRKIIEYLDKCKANKSWPGLKQLPEGAEIYDKIAVTRI
jgi:hypothetical protein